VRSAPLAKRLAGLFALLLGAASSPARAQYVPYGPFEVYPSMQLREGPGFKVLGDGLVIHPGIATELGYDSNMLMASQAGGAGVLRLRASSWSLAKIRYRNCQKAASFGMPSLPWMKL